VAKEASDLILLTDNFSIIVAAVEEGRVIIDNIRKAITFMTAECFSEIILIGGSIIFNLPLLILPAQILWENLIEGSPQGIALAFEPKEKDIMQRKPESPKSPLFTREMKIIIFAFGIFTDILLFLLCVWLLKKGSPLAEIRTIAFVGLALGSFFYLLSCKNLRRNLWQYNPFSNPYLIFSLIFGLLMLLVAVYTPPFQFLLKTAPLNLSHWLLLIVFGIINLILIEVTKWYFISKRKKDDQVSFK
jgi:Ca2+-transporting ATPase